MYAVSCYMSGVVSGQWCCWPVLPSVGDVHFRSTKTSPRLMLMTPNISDRLKTGSLSLG